jgi:hypothetical protein
MGQDSLDSSDTEKLIKKDDDFINNLCGNHGYYREILEWVRDFNYDTRISINSCIIITGISCIGKTYSINSICSYLNYEIISIDNSTCYNSIQLRDVIHKTTSSSLLQILTNNIRKKVIIIDNFDCIFMADKTINITLLKILKDSVMKNIPIICISNNDIIKKIGDIKKVCKIYSLALPSKNDVVRILLNKGFDKSHIEVLYNISNGNLDKLFNDSVKKKSDTLYNDNIEDNSDINILYINKFDRNRVQRIISKDSWMIPLKFHENLIKELNNRTISHNNKNKFYNNFMEIMCLYDYYMFKNNIEISMNIFSSYVYFLSILKYKKGSVSNIGKFTKILSYLSLQKKNIKHTYNSSNFPLYQLSIYHTNLCNRKFISFN